MLAPQSFNLPNVIGLDNSETAVVSGALNRGFIVAGGSGAGALLPSLAITEDGFSCTIVNASGGNFEAFPQSGDEINGASSAIVPTRTTATLVKTTIAGKPMWHLG